MKRIILTFILLIQVFFIQAQVKLGLPFIKYYSTNDYNAGIQNWHISQDSRGIIYVANNFGMLEFDGSSWRLYPVVNGVKVRHFNFSPDKKINIASQGEFGYFSNNLQGQWEYHSISGNLPPENRDFEETWKVFHLDGKDYFCTSNKIFIVENEKTEIISSELTMDNFFLVNQVLYVYRPSEGLSMLQNGKFVNVINGEQLLGINITEIIPLSNNRLMIVTKQNGILIVGSLNNTVWQPDQQEIFSRSIINAALRLRNGDFAFGTQNNGLMIYSLEGELKSHLTKNLGLNNRTIICLFEDKQNNLWAGHNNGISYVEFGQPFSFINEHMGLPGTGYDGFQDDENLFLGTNNGLYKSVESLTSPNDGFQILESSEGQVYHINKIDNLYLMGHNNGAFVYNGMGELKKVGNGGTWIFQQLNSNPDYLIAGTYNGLELYRKTSNSLINLWKLSGFNESCRVFEQDDHGNIWMAHGYKGVFRFKLSDDLKSVQEVKFYGVDQGFPNNTLISVYKIRRALCFTTVDGVYQYDFDHDRFVKDPFFEKYFEPDSPINVLAEDVNENIYFLGQNEIGVLRKDAAGDYHKETDKFNKIKGMLNDDLQNISILPNNKVLYGTKEGFVVYDPVNDFTNTYDFRILMRRITLTDRPDSTIFFGNDFAVDESEANPDPKTTKFSYDHNSIKFEYSASFMDGLNMNTYQYYLEGFDMEWSDWNKKNEKEYTNLQEGNYSFKVRAKNLLGQISNETAYEFIVLPPWHRTKLAYATYFLLFSITFLSLLGYISRKHKREKKVMIQKQETELDRRDSELKSIKTKSEQEIERLKTEKLKTDIKHKNKELATATMHLINKNEFISHVKQNLTSLVRKNPKDPLINDLVKIMSSIDRNISEDDDWQHFEMHFDQVHGDFSSRLKEKYPNLSPQDRRLCAYLRMNMTTKEIANLLNITVRGAEISRYRLRKKLELERETNLAEFILNF